MSTSELCQACGLCCDGARFTLVPLRADEAAPPGLPIVDRPDGGRALRQPCPALEGTRCAVYAARPRACREHECLLYSAVADKELELSEALAIVREAKALVRERRAGAFLARHFGVTPAGRLTEAPKS